FHVTGVQTCALPIYGRHPRIRSRTIHLRASGWWSDDGLGRGCLPLLSSYIFSLFGVEADDLLISEFVQTIFPIFAAITRSLDTAEGRVRLHCSRASVDRNSAGPDFQCHAIGLPSIRRINCSGQAKIAGVGQCYGLIIVVKTNDRTDGAEYFFLRKTAVILHIVKQGRFKEKALVETFRPLAAGNQCSTFILCDSNIFLGPFACDFA